MVESKYFILKSFEVQERVIYPIAKLTLIEFHKMFYHITYTIVAMKISENNQTYYKNINLSNSDFETLKEKI